MRARYVRGELCMRGGGGGEESEGQICEVVCERGE